MYTRQLVDDVCAVIQPEKKAFQVMYVDEEKDLVVLADENFDEVSWCSSSCFVSFLL